MPERDCWQKCDRYKCCWWGLRWKWRPRYWKVGGKHTLMIQWQILAELQFAICRNDECTYLEEKILSKVLKALPGFLLGLIVKCERKEELLRKKGTRAWWFRKSSAYLNWRSYAILIRVNIASLYCGDTGRFDWFSYFKKNMADHHIFILCPKVIVVLTPLSLISLHSTGIPQIVLQKRDQTGIHFNDAFKMLPYRSNLQFHWLPEIEKKASNGDNDIKSP